MSARFAARLLVLAAGLGLLAGGAAADDKKDDKKPEKPKSIKEIMRKAHAPNNKKNYVFAVDNGLKAGEWDKVNEAADVLKVYGEALGEFDPPKGDAASWKKLSDKYKATTSDLEAAAEKKDADGAKKAVKTIQGMCKECHPAHKP